MDVQLPAKPVDESGFSQQRPLETQDGCPARQGKNNNALGHKCDLLHHFDHNMTKHRQTSTVNQSVLRGSLSCVH